MKILLELVSIWLKRLLRYLIQVFIFYVLFEKDDILPDEQSNNVLLGEGNISLVKV